MNVVTHRRLTAIAVVTMLAVQLLIMVYLWRLGRLSAVSPLAFAKVAFVVVAFLQASRNESQWWTGVLALGGLGSVIRGLIDVPQSPASWLESGSNLFVGVTAALWWWARCLHTELAKISMIPLRAPIKHAFETYGDPTESYPDEDHPGSTVYTFEPDDLHRVVIIEWQGLVHSITYWSECSYPAADLRHVLRQYAEGEKWRLVERGYLYWREDEDRRLWCSAIPAIGVGTTEHMRAKPEDEPEEIDT